MENYRAHPLWAVCYLLSERATIDNALPISELRSLQTNLSTP